MEEKRNKPWNLHTCTMCYYASKSIFVMCQHVRLHTSRSETHAFSCSSDTPEMYECEICEFETDVKVSLNEHFRVYHKETGSNGILARILKCYRCKNCNFETRSVLVLARHVDVCKKVSKNLAEDYSDQWYEFKSNGAKQWKYYKCKQCPFQTAHFVTIKNHVVESKHLLTKDFQCEKCLYNTSRKHFLEKHMLSRHKDKETLHKCELCNYKAKKKCRVEAHKLRVHIIEDKKTLHKCELCSYKAKMKCRVEAHKLRMHSNPLLQCEHCSYQTRFRQSLKDHIFGHTLQDYRLALL